MTTQRFQILSLDGGGLRGMFSAAVLARLEEDLGIRVTDHFDLIAGTSTGGIIALGLGLGMTPREILEFYTDLGPRVFRDRSRLRGLRHLVRAKYAAGPLRAALTEVLGERTFGESTKRLVITSYNVGRRRRVPVPHPAPAAADPGLARTGRRRRHGHRRRPDLSARHAAGRYPAG
ncbi:patatin-like phospholipase family protein [Micromonospora sp. WMMD961]|uniref:patatin-like phospholipase family protein n=1 Tax=Micromonospora sp. WMMD961 TaxID=3016100 RepID=UPI002415A46E|nr:patatin-like phospholipase family protein [Micromonospora sp. WMMD961]MDG4778937.1 patatin-like phospholipase family protein [Micromonospora sp. WMMD961]